MTISDLASLVTILVTLGVAAIATYNYIRTHPDRKELGQRIGITVLVVILVLGGILVFENVASRSGPGSRTLGDIFGKDTPTPTLIVATDTPAATPTSVPTATPLPKPGTLLYTANWSGGMNGWNGAPEWKTTNGMLVSDGSNASSGFGEDAATCCDVVAPYQLGSVNDYAVEVRMQYTSVNSLHLPSFGIVVREDPAQSGTGYYGAFGRASCCSPTKVAYINRASSTDVDVQGDTLVERNYNWDGNWHIYRIEVQSNQIRLFVDGYLLTHVTDNNFLAGGAIGLRADGTQVQVSSVKVIAL